MHIKCISYNISRVIKVYEFVKEKKTKIKIIISSSSSNSRRRNVRRRARTLAETRYHRDGEDEDVRIHRGLLYSRTHVRRSARRVRSKYRSQSGERDIYVTYVTLRETGMRERISHRGRFTSRSSG